MNEKEKKGQAAAVKKSGSDVGLVRIAESDKRYLEKLSQGFGGESMSKVLHRVIDDYRRNRYFERLNASYAELKADPEAWKREQDERKIWEATLADGLEDK